MNDYGNAERRGGDQVTERPHFPEHEDDPRLLSTDYFDPESGEPTIGRCVDCGAEAEVLDLNAYGPGKTGAYCTICFISNNRRDTIRIATTVLGEPAEVLVLTEGTTCANCGTYVLAPDALYDPIVDHPDYRA